MKLLLQNTVNGLIPLYPSDYEEKRKLKLGETYEVEIKRPRNIGYHRKFFALLNVGHSNTQLQLPFDIYRMDLDKEIKELTEKKKAREKFLQAVTEEGTVDPKTGVFINRAPKSSTTKVIVKV